MASSGVSGQSIPLREEGASTVSVIGEQPLAHAVIDVDLRLVRMARAQCSTLQADGSTHHFQRLARFLLWRRPTGLLDVVPPQGIHLDSIHSIHAGTGASISPRLPLPSSCR